MKTLAYWKKALKASLIIQVSLLFLWACGNREAVEVFTGPTMGTSYNIKAEFAKPVDHAAVQKAITDRLEVIEQSMSTYRPTSEISRFSQLPVGQSMTVSDDFLRVFDVSRQVYLLSGGAFNPSVAALVNLWGFGPKLTVEQFQHAPSDEAIQAARASMHFDKIQVNGNTLLKQDVVSLDFSAVAKGYAVDEIGKVLEGFSAHSYMVEIGGEVITRGESPRHTPWRIGIELPQMLRGSVMSALVLADAAVATSGDYRNYIEIDGKRYSHTIDPRTAFPIAHKLTSVTVLAKTVAEADAWATAMMVLGEDEGFALAQKLEMPAYYIYRSDNGFAVKHTAQMQQYLAEH